MRFVTEAKDARVAGFGVVFIDTNYPSIAESQLMAYTETNEMLGELVCPNVGSGQTHFLGFVATDRRENPRPVISRVVIKNGSGWPEVYSAEGVTLDDFTFTDPTQ